MTNKYLILCSFALLFCFFSLQAQFQVKIPGGELVGIARHDDTLYFWGNNHLWRSTDWGETMVKWKRMESGKTGYFFPDGFQAPSQGMSHPELRSGHLLYYRVDANGGVYYQDWLFLPEFNEIFYKKFSVGVGSLLFDRAYPTGMRFGPLHCSSGIFGEYIYQYLDEAGNEHQLKRNFPTWPIDSEPILQIYNNKRLIGIRNNKLFLLNTIDSSIIEQPFPGNFLLKTADFQNLSLNQTGIFGDGDTFFLLNPENQAIESKAHPVFPYLKKWIFGSEIAYQDSSGFQVFDVFSDQVRTVENLPVNYQGMDFYFVGSDYLAFYDKISESLYYTRDLGQNWHFIPRIGIISSQFQGIMDWDGYLYAMNNHKLYRTPCSRPDSLMEFVKTLPDNITSLQNVGSTLIQLGYSNIYSTDFGTTWTAFPQANVFIDYDFKRMYAYFGWNGTTNLLQSKDQGLSWEYITPPQGLNWATSPANGFAAHGDTLLLCEFRSFNGGQSWDALNLSAFANPPQDIFEALNNRFIFIGRNNSVGKVSTITDFNGETIWSDISYVQSFSATLDKHHTVRSSTTYYPSGGFSYTDKYISFRKIKVLDLARSYLPLESWEPDSIKQVGIADHYLFADSNVYHIAPHLLLYSSCAAEYTVNGQTYSPGDYIYSGDICEVDTILRVKQYALYPLTLPNQTLCPGDTVWFYGKALTSLGMYNKTLPGQNGHCDTLAQIRIDMFPSTKTNQYFACKGQKIPYKGDFIDSNSSIFSHYVYNADSLCRYAVSDSFFFYNTDLVNTAPPISLCEGEQVLYNGQVYDHSTVVEQYERFANGFSPGGYVCKKTVQAIIEIGPENDTIARYYCEDQPIVHHGMHYPDSSIVFDEHGPCNDHYLHLIRLPVTHQSIDTSSLGVVNLFGHHYYSDTTVIRKRYYAQIFCDSLIQTYHVHILSSGTVEVNGSQRLSVYPNPVHQKLIILLNSPSTDAEWQLYDALGRHVLQVRLSSEKTELNLSDHEEGIYYWQIKEGKNLLSGKIAVLH